MNPTESIEEFYKRKFGWLPERLKNEIGHFNLFNLEPIPEGTLRPLPYRRRDYYKVMLVLGNIDFQYADKTVSTQRQALVFSNPQIPYTCGHLERIKGGHYCIFNRQFFHGFGDINRYEVFQPTSDHVYELTDEELVWVKQIYKRMFAEFASDYTHKYDALRTLVFELLHFAMKKHPFKNAQKQEVSASKRIASLFLELLERQFPIDENYPQVSLRSASNFAEQLNVHVNHLNRAVKQTTEKTTSQIISERLLQEAKILLKYSNWNVSEIAFALGFTEATHFNNFFKKRMATSPLKFRKACV